MNKDPGIYIDHILESIDLIEDYLEGKTKEDFLASKQLEDSVIRRIEIIGEAAKNISSDIRAQYPDIPWSDIAGMRDILIHKYFGIDLELTWQAANKDIPDLKTKLIRLKDELKP
jgi:uncharacterized protein with HEPN domain